MLYVCVFFCIKPIATTFLEIQLGIMILFPKFIFRILSSMKQHCKGLLRSMFVEKIYGN